MARTRRDEGVNADPAGQNISSAPNLGAAQQSSNDWMGITQDNVKCGSMGPREGMSMKYGGDQHNGILFKGTSAGMDNSALKQTNAAFGQEKMSWNSGGQYGPGSPNYLAGGYGAREQMTYGGDQNKGQYVGDGVNATPDADMTQYFISGKVPIQMPKNQFLAGTDEARGTGITGANNSSTESGSNTNNMIRAKRGIGKPVGSKND